MSDSKRVRFLLDIAFKTFRVSSSYEDRIIVGYFKGVSEDSLEKLIPKDIRLDVNYHLRKMSGAIVPGGYQRTTTPWKILTDAAWNALAIAKAFAL